VSDGTTSRGDRLLEIIAVVLLAVTTLGTAWCGYQSSAWNGTQTDLARESSDERVEAAKEFGLATQKVAYDAGLVAQYAQAVQSKNTALAEFYKKTLVRPQFLPLLEQWQAEVVAGGTPTSLFTDPAYLDAQFLNYNEATKRAEAANEASQAAGNTADSYVLTTILLAVALFFAGVTSSFRYKPARVLLIILAIGTVALAATRLADLPIA
jgi:hypothetical protein